MIMVLLVFARLPNCVRYCCASCMLTDWMPPSPLMAVATFSMPAACASATSRISLARPSASLMRLARSPSESAIACWRSPSARLIFAWRSPSDSAIIARFSRSARICFSIASRIVRGGVMFLIS